MNPNEIKNPGRLLSEYNIFTETAKCSINIEFSIYGIKSRLYINNLDVKEGDVFARNGFVFKILPVSENLIKLQIFEKFRLCTPTKM